MSTALAKNSKAPGLSKRALKEREIVAQHMWDGMSLVEVAAKISKDPERRKYWRNKIRKWLQRDPTFRELLAVGQQGEMWGNLIPVTQGVIARGKRGRVDAAKLIFEMTGVHNPRVQRHEHSGDINVRVSAMPRPKQIDSGQVVDAEVVED